MGRDPWPPLASTADCDLGYLRTAGLMRVGFGGRPFCAICKGMHTLSRIGLLVILTAGLAMPTDVSFARRAQHTREQPPVAWHPSGSNVRCVERSFSISVGYPAYKNRLAHWPAPCGR